ncbi:MAG TPA: hypothetical protein VKY31_14135 [Terriglobia bacterium]|nr:hypothetical protein [Terriglobia bacterium]
MPSWISALVFAFLVVVIPYTLLFKILLQLPKPVALSHKRWPLPANVALIGAITVWATVFIHSAYYHRGFMNPAGVAMQFVIAALVYAFGLVLLLRQFCGLYPEFFVTTGWSGLSLRKTAYRNVIGIQELGRISGEARLQIETSYGLIVALTLPTRYVPMLYERVKPPL